MRARPSIAGLMAAIILLAVGLAGLRAASALWASALFSLTLALLATASLGVAATRGPARMASLGFAIFGWTYLLATFGLWPGPNGVSAPPLLTKALLDALQPPSQTSTAMTVDRGPAGEMMTGEPPPMVETLVPGTANMVTTAPYTGRVIGLHHYRRIGHTLAAIGFGLLGGLLGALSSSSGRPRGRQGPDGDHETEHSSSAAH